MCATGARGWRPPVFPGECGARPSPMLVAGTQPPLTARTSLSLSEWACCDYLRPRVNTQTDWLLIARSSIWPVWTRGPASLFWAIHHMKERDGWLRRSPSDRGNQTSHRVRATTSLSPQPRASHSTHTRPKTRSPALHGHSLVCSLHP